MRCRLVDRMALDGPVAAEPGTRSSGRARIVRATRWFRDQGLALRRVLTDSGKRSRPRAFRHVVQLLGLTHARTRPYRPQTNGECERWIRTALGECLYLKVFSSSTKRRRPLERFVPWYKEARPHLGLGGRTPRQRLREKLAAWWCEQRPGGAHVLCRMGSRLPAAQYRLWDAYQTSSGY